MLTLAIGVRYLVKLTKLNQSIETREYVPTIAVNAVHSFSNAYSSAELNPFRNIIAHLQKR